MNITVFTDGSAKKNGSKDAVSGVGVYFSESDPRNVSDSLASKYAQFFPNIKNFKSKAELMAILVALNLLKSELDSNKKVTIVTDSMYSVNSLTIWYHKWKLNDWKNSSNKVISNKEIIEKLITDYILKFPKQIVFFHVNSHTKYQNDWDSNKKFLWDGNHRADFLASNF